MNSAANRGTLRPLLRFLRHLERGSRAFHRRVGQILGVRIVRSARYEQLKEALRTSVAALGTMQLQPAPMDFRRLSQSGRSSVEEAAKAGDFEAYRRKIAEILSTMPRPTKLDAPSIIICGYARTGKSTIAKIVCTCSDYLYVPCDELNCLAHIEGAADQARLREILSEEVLAVYGRGALLDTNWFVLGDDDAIHPRLVRLAGMHSGPIFLVGNARVSVAAKVRGYEVHRDTGICWTIYSPRWGDPLDRAQKSIAVSTALEALSGVGSIRYIDIDPESFSHSVRNAVQTILKSIEAQENAPRAVASCAMDGDGASPRNVLAQDSSPESGAGAKGDGGQCC